MSVIEKWRCENCLDLHDTEESAAECCPPQVVQVWVCETCADEHRLREDAEECCLADGEGRIDAGLLFPSPRLANNPAAYIKAFHELNGLIA
jgi:hypothetical protein